MVLPRGVDLKVKAYFSDAVRDTCLLLRAEADSSTLPVALRHALGALECCKELDLQTGQQPVGMNVGRAIEDIENLGYHLSKARLAAQPGSVLRKGV